MTTPEAQGATPTRMRLERADLEVSGLEIACKRTFYVRKCIVSKYLHGRRLCLTAFANAVNAASTQGCSEFRLGVTARIRFGVGIILCVFMKVVAEVFRDLSRLEVGEVFRDLSRLEEHRPESLRLPIP